MYKRLSFANCSKEVFFLQIEYKRLILQIV